MHKSQYLTLFTSFIYYYAKHTWNLIQSNLLERPPVYKDHLSIKTSFVQSLYLFHAIKPVYKDHLSNATRDRPILGPYSQLHPAYKDHNVTLVLSLLLEEIKSWILNFTYFVLMLF